MKPGTKVFVAAWSVECSTLEDPPVQGDDDMSLRACARAVNAGIATKDVVVFVDGKRVPVTEVTSGLLRLDGEFPPGTPLVIRSTTTIIVKPGHDRGRGEAAE